MLASSGARPTMHRVKDRWTELFILSLSLCCSMGQVTIGFSDTTIETINEGATVTKDVCRDFGDPNTNAVLFSLTVSRNTGQDVILPSGNSLIPAGMRCVAVEISAFDDSMREDTETFQISLSSPFPSTVDIDENQNQFILYIEDSDGTGTFNFCPFRTNAISGTTVSCPFNAVAMSVCTYQCINGYTVVAGLLTRTCIPDTLRWTGNPPVCAPSSTPSTPVIINNCPTNPLTHTVSSILPLPAFFNTPVPTTTDISTRSVTGVPVNNLFPEGSTFITYTFTNDAGSQAVCIFTIIIDVDYCNPRPVVCQTGTTCVEGSPDQSQITCVVTPCDPNPCINGGTCNPTGNTFFCLCDTGFSGATCDMVDSDLCDAITCTGATEVCNLNNGVAQCTDLCDAITCTGATEVCTLNNSVAQCTADDTPPVATCPAEVREVLPTGSATVVVTWNVEFTDNSGTVTVMQEGPRSGDSFGIGTSVTTYTASDEAGNVVMCTVTVIVSADPGVMPTPTDCPSSFTAFTNNPLAQMVIFPQVLAVDTNGNILTGVLTNPAINLFTPSNPAQPATVTFTFTDASGLTAICMFEFNFILDQTSPTFVGCPQGDTLPGTLPQGATTVPIPAVQMISAVDDASVPTVVTNPTDVTAFPFGTTLVTFTATDMAGNTAQCTFTVEVNSSPCTPSPCLPTEVCTPVVASNTFTCAPDVEPPMLFNCPMMSVTATPLPGQNTAVINNFPVVTATDNLDNDLISSSNVPHGNIFPTGTTSITITFTDDAGNSESCMFDVVVEDVLPPLIKNCPLPPNPSITAMLQNGQDMVTVLELAVTDNFDVNPMVIRLPSSNSFPAGITQVSVTVTDASGNIATCAYNVEVSSPCDSVLCSPPSTCVNGPGGATCAVSCALASCNNMGNFCIEITPGIGTCTGDTTECLNNCNVPTQTLSCQAGRCISSPVPRTDCPGGCLVGQTCTAGGVCVLDSDPPTANCPPPVTENLPANQDTITIILPVTVTDSQDPNPSILISPVENQFSAGTTPVTVTAIDDAGNMDVCTFNVEVTDIEDMSSDTSAPVYLISLIIIPLLLIAVIVVFIIKRKNISKEGKATEADDGDDTDYVNTAMVDDPEDYIPLEEQSRTVSSSKYEDLNLKPQGGESIPAQYEVTIVPQPQKPVATPQYQTRNVKGVSSGAYEDVGLSSENRQLPDVPRSHSSAGDEDEDNIEPHHGASVPTQYEVTIDPQPQKPVATPRYQTRNVKEVNSGAYEDVGVSSENRQLPDVPRSHSSAGDEDEDNSYEVPDKLEEYAGVYINIKAEPVQPGPIKVAEFQNFMSRNKEDVVNDIVQQFMALPSGPQYPWSVALKFQNKPRNFFKTILAYDHSRVKLDTNGSDARSDYINASYIKNQQGKTSCIAAQGPQEGTVDDFWKMVWQENVEIIVMVTDNIEKNKLLCCTYWPEKVCTSEVFGDISVLLMESTSYTTHTIRKLNLFKGNQKTVHTVTQVHVHSWPYGSVPKEPAPLISIIKKVKSLQKAGSSSPLLVHCSNGVGATGTFIAVYVLMDTIKKNKDVNVFDFVKRMREDRVDMVQTRIQYLFIFECLLAVLQSTNSQISCDQLKKLGHDAIKLKSKKEYKVLQESVKAEQHFENYDGNSPENQHKNRFKDLIPVDKFRPVLKSGGSTFGSNNYINAIHLTDFGGREFIMTQTPLSSTVEDFWRLVYDYECTTIVMLNTVDGSDETVVQYWPSGGGAQYGLMKVECISTTKRDSYIQSQFQVAHKKVGESVSVDHFAFSGWSTNQPDVSKLQQLIRCTGNKNNGPVLVHCINGVGLSAMYAIVKTESERLEQEGSINVFQSLTKLRKICPHAIQTQEEYTLCYQLLKDHLDNPEEYAVVC